MLSLFNAFVCVVRGVLCNVVWFVYLCAVGVCVCRMKCLFLRFAGDVWCDVVWFVLTCDVLVV